MKTSIAVVTTMTWGRGPDGAGAFDSGVATMEAGYAARTARWPLALVAQDEEQLGLALGFHEPGTAALVAQEPGHAGEHLQIGSRQVGRPGQQEDQVCRLAVDGLPLNAGPAARERRDGTLEARQPRVGNRHAIAQRGRNLPLPLAQRLHQAIAFDVAMLGGHAHP